MDIFDIVTIGSGIGKGLMALGEALATKIEGMLARGAVVVAEEATVQALSKGERLGMVYERVSNAPAATTAEEAMQQMHGTLEAVENAFSGVPKATNPGLKPDGRMYPVQPDRIATAADGTITATSRGHVTTYGPSGSITVTSRSTGEVVFQKAGGG